MQVSIKNAPKFKPSVHSDAFHMLQVVNSKHGFIYSTPRLRDNSVFKKVQLGVPVICFVAQSSTVSYLNVAYLEVKWPGAVSWKVEQQTLPPAFIV
jgi:hypothetical protein